ncbi:MAG: restriction endonuclease subunit S, partial [Hymenobacter sp.]
CVLRPKAGVLHSNYLLHWVKSPAFINDMVARATGANYPAVSDKTVKTALIPLPSFEEQQRIADTLDTADALYRKDQELLRKYDALAQSIFYEMFGIPTQNSLGWQTEKIGDLTDVSSGSTPNRERDDYFGGSIKWVKTTEVRGGKIFNTEETLTPLGLNSSSCKLFPPKTILIAMYGQGRTRGQVGLLECEAATNQACAAILPSPSFEPTFLFYALKLSYSQLRELGRGGNQQNLNLGMVKDFSVIVPDLESQKKFVAVLHQVENSIARAVKASTHSEHLFSSLLTSYFA